MSNHLDFSAHGYQVEQELGSNRLGGRVTYKATNLATQTPVVLKNFQFAQTDSNWSGYQACKGEIQLLQQLNHPSIPQYIDSLETPTGFCLVQEYKQATSLAVPRRFSPEEIKEIAIAVLEVLVYLQRQSPLIIHRDIKPENILVERGEQLKVYLVDFGFARLGGNDLAISSVVKGTLGFMPPEQMFNRQLTEASDLYSLGATLMCLLTGIPSQRVGDLLDESNRFQFRYLPPELHPSFTGWLAKMVAPSLQERYANAAKALQTLKPLPVKRIPRQEHSSPHKPAWKLLTAMSLLSIFSIMLTHLKAEQKTSELPSPAPSPIIIEEEPSNILLRTGECPGCDLAGVNLENVNLGKANLAGANLAGANLRNANLEDAHLRRANLQDAILEGVNLDHANLKQANLKGANLIGAELEKANLKEAILDGATLNQANLEEAQLEDASLRYAFLTNTDLEEAYLWRADLEGAELVEAKLEEANLEKANLENTQIIDSNLEDANLRAADLRAANLLGSNLEDANLDEAYIEGANWEGTVLPDGTKYFYEY